MTVIYRYPPKTLLKIGGKSFDLKLGWSSLEGSTVRSLKFCLPEGGWEVRSEFSNLFKGEKGLFLDRRPLSSIPGGIDSLVRQASISSKMKSPPLKGVKEVGKVERIGSKVKVGLPLLEMKRYCRLVFSNNCSSFGFRPQSLDVSCLGAPYPLLPQDENREVEFDLQLSDDGRSIVAPTRDTQASSSKSSLKDSNLFGVLRGELPNFGRFSKKYELRFRGTRDTETADASKEFKRKLLEQIECTQDNNSTSLELQPLNVCANLENQNLEMQFSEETLHEKDSILNYVLSKGRDETSSGIVSEEEIDKKELEAHYGFMAKIQEVLPAESNSTDTPLEQNVTDERAALANLIANLTLDTEENKTILKQLKKANASLTQELKECRTNLDETGRALGEATSCRDSCLIALQNKQNEFEKYLNDVNARTKKPKVVPISASKPKRKANKSGATPHKKTVASDTTNQKSKSYYKELYENTNQEWKWWIAKKCPSGYKWTQKPHRTKKIWMPKIRKENIVQLIVFIVDSGCTKHMTGNLKLLCNFVEKFLGTVHFGNDQFAPILSYGDLNQGNVTIERVYYVEGLNHNLFSVGQLCDADFEVAFRKSTCFVRDLQGNDLLTGNRGSDLYTISLQETTSSTPICFMAKASPTQAWLWHRRLSHLNFDYITLLSKKDVWTGLT
ncbi:retrovirus-related pol polyprotein from transposon TNT 1-94 [Tanacetum coccineum]